MGIRRDNYTGLLGNCWQFIPNRGFVFGCGHTVTAACKG